MLLQGMWFVNIGFILYPPKGWKTWNQEGHADNLIITALFGWNVMLAAGVYSTFIALIHFSVRRQVLGMGKAKAAANNGHGDPLGNGYTQLMQDDEDDPVDRDALIVA